MKQLTIVAIIFASAFLIIQNYHGEQTQTLKEKYLQYLKKYGKQIPEAQQFEYRVKIFSENVIQIQRHNMDTTKTWKMGINQFTDITQQEFVATYLGELNSTVPEVFQEQPINAGFNGEIDWRKKDIVTAVKNQGQCGSCWAFAATAAHQSYQVQVHGFPKTLSLSQQQLVDCATSQPYDNHGCNGGFGSRALGYIKDHGQTTSDQYPYKAVNQDCQTPSGSYKTFGVSDSTGCSEIQIIIQRRPMAVRVDATNWKTYASGVFDNCDVKLNHGVFLVGSSQDAWTIKNSWSASWGESGFIRLSKGNTCGVCIGPSFPI